jgi:hypothetical protein
MMFYVSCMCMLMVVLLVLAMSLLPPGLFEYFGVGCRGH